MKKNKTAGTTAAGINRNMASFFESNIKLPELIRWIGWALDAVIKKHQPGDVIWLTGFLYNFIPELMECKTPAERKVYLENNLNKFFEHDVYGWGELSDVLPQVVEYNSAGSDHDQKHIDFIMHYVRCIMSLGLMHKDYMFYKEHGDAIDNNLLRAAA